MSVDPSNESGGWSCVRDALAEIRAYPDTVQTFVSSVLDQLSRMTDELLARDLAQHKAHSQSEREALRNQIDRLASVVAELAETVSEERQLVERKSQKGLEKYATSAV
jgi:hypothetical protein